MLYTHFLKKALFLFDPEKAHHFTIDQMRRLSGWPGGTRLLSLLYGVKDEKELGQELMGLFFSNPIGLAAGLDKNAEAIPAFSSIGFGFVEVGTLTPRPQSGNELPRLFRLPEEQALINRMGFNNQGAEEAAKGLAKLITNPVPIGINIGKNKTTPNEDANEDYRKCLQVLYSYGDYFVINISSPNTPGLRSLQHGEELLKLVSAVQNEAVKLSGYQPTSKAKPILVKIAPDLTDEELKETVDILTTLDISGIIATNTTLDRSGIQHRHAHEAGGLSGYPLKDKSTDIIRKVYRLTDGRLPIVGVGGVFNGRDAYEKIKAGASLVQVYTSLIYEGPGLLRRINQELLQCLHADGYTHISQAIGIEA